jgi:hypothetical protein
MRPMEMWDGSMRENYFEKWMEKLDDVIVFG